MLIKGLFKEDSDSVIRLAYSPKRYRYWLPLEQRAGMIATHEKILASLNLVFILVI